MCLPACLCDKARQSRLAPALSTLSDFATSVGRFPTRVLPQWYDRSIQNQELKPFYRDRISALFYISLEATG